METNENNTLHAAFKSAAKHHLKKGDIIKIENHKIFFVLIDSGYIKRYLITDEGNQSIQAIFGPKTTFPLTPVYSALLDLTIYEGDEVTYYESMTDSIVHSLTKNQLQNLADSDPTIYKELFHSAGVRLKSNIQRLENMSLRSVDKRVADALLHYARNFGKQRSGGEVVIDLPMTHQTIANNLTIARETVSLVLGRLVDQNIIELLPKFHILIHDMQALKNSRS